jgi:mRNA interferase MazF
MGMEVNRFGVYLVSFDPTVGSEISKKRPAVIVSPDEMNHFLNTVIVAPLTSALKNYPSRVSIHFEGKVGEIALDQIRTIDKRKLKKCLDLLDENCKEKVLDVLQRMFAK